MGECRGVTHVWGTPPRFTGQRWLLPGSVRSIAQTRSLPGFLPVLGAWAPDTQSRTGEAQRERHSNRGKGGSWGQRRSALCPRLLIF